MIITNPGRVVRATEAPRSSPALTAVVVSQSISLFAGVVFQSPEFNSSTINSQNSQLVCLLPAGIIKMLKLQYGSSC